MQVSFMKEACYNVIFDFLSLQFIAYELFAC